MKSRVKFLIDKAAKGNGLELTGFPNVISAQECLLAQSHHSISNLLPPAASRSLEMDAFSSNTASSTVDSEPSQQSTSLLDGDDGDFIIQNWRFHYSQFPGICRFFGRERNNIKTDVLLAAIRGIITDSENFDCERVDLKWTSYLEGALAQTKSCTRDEAEEGRCGLILASLDDAVTELIESQHKVIERNNIVSANTTKHHTMLEQTVKRMSSVSEQLSIISRDLQKALIFNVEPRDNPSSPATTSPSSMAIVPRSPHLHQKSFSIVHDGVRLTVTLCPDHASSASKQTIKEMLESEDNSTLSEASQLELHHLMVSSIIKLTKSTKSFKDKP